MSKSVFISYAHADPDEQVARWTESLLSQQGYDVWIDLDSACESTGLELNKQIANRIVHSEYFFFVCSSNSISSKYCLAELNWATKHEKTIIVIELEELLDLPQEIFVLREFSKKTINLWARSRETWSPFLFSRLKEYGIVLGHEETIEAFDYPLSRRIRPDYMTLSKMTPDEVMARSERLRKAASMSKDNAYTYINLCCLCLHIGQNQQALKYAELSMERSPADPNAYYAYCLSVCSLVPARCRSTSQAESIINMLVRARNLSGSYAHVDFLLAMVIANCHMERFLAMPEKPGRIIQNIVARKKLGSPSEIIRTMHIERPVSRRVEVELGEGLERLRKIVHGLLQKSSYH